MLALREAHDLRQLARQVLVPYSSCLLLAVDVLLGFQCVLVLTLASV
jgi:hypothetical protein